MQVRSASHVRPVFHQAIESLEDRRLMAASSIKFTGNDLRDVIANTSTGAKANANDLILTFSGNVKSVDISKIRMFAFAADNTSDSGAQIKKTIGITRATIDSKDAKRVTLRTSMIVRKGASIELQAGAVKDNNGDDITGKQDSKKGVNKQRFTLAGRAFKVTDKSLFSNDVLEGGRTPITANSAPTESSVRTALTAFLDKKVRQKTITQAKRDAALERFNSSSAKGVVADHNLRAAILSLTGTVAEPAIAFYLDGKNTTGKAPVALRFDAKEFDSGARIVATTFNNEGRLRVIFNPNFAGESFVVLSGILAHEVNQETKEPSDQRRSYLSQDEQVLANYMEACVYAQQLAADSSYASRGTNLTLRANYRLYLAMNSGSDQFPRAGILGAPLLTGSNAAPGFDTSDSDAYGTQGDDTVRSFDQDVRREFASRNVSDKTNPPTIKDTAKQIFQNITGKTYGTVQYSDAMIADVDKNQDVMGDSQVLLLAKFLKVRI